MNTQLQPLEHWHDELFVNREEELAHYWEWGNSIPDMPANSHALIGLRRTGKTAILVKIFNRLFYEQTKVMPVYISFSEFLGREEPITSYEFAEHYFSGYVRSYLAFHYREPNLIRSNKNFDSLRHFAQQVNDQYILELYETYELSLDAQIPSGLISWIINFPSGEAAIRKIPTAIIVDEFQILTHVYDPRQDVYRDLTNGFQRAVETSWAPVLVSGSAISLLVSEALGGMLQGRFGYWFLKPLEQGFAHDLVYRFSDRLGIEATDELAELVYEFTGGNPYSIYCLMNSQSPERQKLPDADAMQKVLTYELSNTNGRIFQHYQQEFTKYSDELNHGTTTRRVMLWVTKFPDKLMDAEMASEALGIELGGAREALEKLRWADVVEKQGMITYKGPTDPMMRRYIEYQHAVEITRVGPERAIKDWEQEYQRILGKLNSTKGELGEMYASFVMSKFAGQMVDGAACLNRSDIAVLPSFDTIERRGGVVASGIPAEIDIIGEWHESTEEKHESGAWLVEVKYTQQRIGIKWVQTFIQRCETFQEKASYDSVTCWYFSKSGFTKEAVAALDKAGVLYSDWEQFRLLARTCGCLGLPLKVS